MNNNGHYKLLTSYIRDNFTVYFLGVLSVLLCNLGQVYFARAMGHAVDFFSTNKLPEFFSRFDQKDQFFYLFLSILLARFALFFGRIGWRITLGRQTHKISGVLKNKIWQSTKYLKLSDLNEKFTKGALMNLATSDVNQGRFIFGFTLIGVIDVIFLTTLAVLSMLSIDVTLTLISIIVLSLTPFFIRRLSKKEIILYENAQNKLSDFNDLASQAVSTIKLQKLGGISEFWFSKLMGSSEEYRKARLEANLTSLKFYPYMGTASIFSYLILFSFGIYQYWGGFLSVGDFVAMQGLIFLLQEPLTELGFVISEWRKSATSLKRLNEVFTFEKENYLFSNFKNVKEHENNSPVYELSDIHFSYDDGARVLLNNFNLKINKGDRVGITGEIGSGKSTLINILSGLERENRGVVKFKGLHFHSYDHNHLRKEIGIAHQKPFVFAKSIRENVSMDQNLNDEQVLHYLNLAGLKDDVLNFDNGLDTELGEWGINISGGQKQRLSLARVLARDPEVLLLDDCLSAVDTITEEKILSNLNHYMNDKTIIWVAHRESTLKYCDTIINMDML